jgi:hypothetical protein
MGRVVREMNGMDMGVATGLGPVAFSLALWVWTPSGSNDKKERNNDRSQDRNT